MGGERVRSGASAGEGATICDFPMSHGHTHTVINVGLPTIMQKTLTALEFR